MRSVTTQTDVVERDKINLLWVNPEDFNSEIGLHRSLFNASFNLKPTRHSAPHWLNVSRDTDSAESERARVSEWERKREREREREREKKIDGNTGPQHCPVAHVELRIR